MLSAADGRTDDGLFLDLQGPVPLQDFLSWEIPSREMLLRPWLPEKGLVLIHAPRGVGKTFFALSAALAVSSGTSFLKWSAPRPRRVLFVDGEMPASMLQARLAGFLASGNFEPARANLAIFAADLEEFGLPDLSTVDGQRSMAPFLQEVDLIILDNLSTVARTGKENEAESWASLQSWALEQRRAGRSVLFVHHSGKGGDQRGTSKREDVMDSVLKLKRPQESSPEDGARFIVEFTKARGFWGDEARSFEAALTKGEWRISESDRQTRDSQISELRSSGLSQRDIAKQVGASAATVNRALQGGN
jgi:putative DNA primase/helicase